MPQESAEKFVRLLEKSPRGAVFNPCWEVDEENDAGTYAPRIRRERLRANLNARNVRPGAIISDAR
jgi:hypothetical protein